MSTPVLKKAKGVSSGIKIVWKKVKKADKYVIYRKKGNGSLKKVKEVSGKKKSWTDKNVAQGKKYTYAVKAVKNNKSSSKSNKKTAVWLKRPGKVKARSRKGGRLIVSWAKQSGVSRYEIRYSRTKNMKKCRDSDRVRQSRAKSNTRPEEEKDILLQSPRCKKGGGNPVSLRLVGSEEDQIEVGGSREG